MLLFYQYPYDNSARLINAPSTPTLVRRNTNVLSLVYQLLHKVSIYFMVLLICQVLHWPLLALVFEAVFFAVIHNIVLMLFIGMRIVNGSGAIAKEE